MSALLSMVQLSEPIGRQTLPCALGIRLIDIATGDVVDDGLRVVAYPPHLPRRRTPGIANRSGVWAFHGLYGLREFERGVKGPDETQMLRFTVEVVDEWERFLPCQFAVTAPFNGLFSMAALSPLGPFRGVSLFSAPARACPPGFGTVRATIASPTSDNPKRAASWTLMRMKINGWSGPRVYFGVADARGNLGLFFPWPAPNGLRVTSPLGGQSIHGRSWDAQFSAWFDPATARNELLDLDEVLGRIGRAPSTLMVDRSPSFAFSTANVRLGQELILPDLPESPPGSPISQPRLLIFS